MRIITFLLTRRINHTQIIVLGFTLLILLGSVILNLPAASSNGESIGYLNSLFTATSATCVTGLVVVDTFSHWSLIGQITILVLIQIGGLGFMTMTTLFSLLLHRKISYNERMLIAESLNQKTISGAVKLTRRILIGTFVIELIGAVILSFKFIKTFGIANGIYKSIFHSISAFCNAGFDLMGEIEPYSSLMHFQTDFLVNITIILLIIIGGIGFFVWSDLYNNIGRSKKAISLHSKIVLFVTAGLLIIGFIVFLCFEYSNPVTLGNLTGKNKVITALFQSVTTRTAGFNTIDQGLMSDASKIFAMILMVIGGSPGSTAGGIKTVTLGILLLASISKIKGNKDIVVFNKRISYEVVLEVFTIAMISILNICLTSLILAYFENTTFIKILFESVSAFGTVGLSLGITGSLSAVSKIFVITSMFFGRVGVLTIAIALTAKRVKRSQKYRYPEGRIMVG